MSKREKNIAKLEAKINSLYKMASVASDIGMDIYATQPNALLQSIADKAKEFCLLSKVREALEA